MGKKCVITIRLVDEAERRLPEKIREDIETEIRQLLHRVPWAKDVETVVVLEQHCSE